MAVHGSPAWAWLANSVVTVHMSAIHRRELTSLRHLGALMVMDFLLIGHKR